MIDARKGMSKLEKKMDDIGEKFAKIMKALKIDE